MTLRIIREPSVKGTTLGVCFVNDRFAAWSLEDELREVPGKPVSAWKVPGQTAIPAGRYQVVVTESPKFGRRLPLLVDVPGFDGIRIHPGNAIPDTEGCILLGLDRDYTNQRVLRSTAACAVVQAYIEAAIDRNERVYMLIENPMGGWQ